MNFIVSLLAAIGVVGKIIDVIKSWYQIEHQAQKDKQAEKIEQARKDAEAAKTDEERIKAAREDQDANR